MNQMNMVIRDNMQPKKQPEISGKWTRVVLATAVIGFRKRHEFPIHRFEHQMSMVTGDILRPKANKRKWGADFAILSVLVCIGSGGFHLSGNVGEHS